MLFRQLEYFVALSHERHFARAAAACHVSQPALSEAIGKLERELDVSLIQRGHAFEGLTPEGERLVVWAQRILADRDAFKQEVSALHGGLTGRLHVGMIPAMATTVARVIDAFAADHPQVTVQLDADLPSAEIVRRLRHFELDAGLLYLDREPTSDLELVPLYEERQVLLAPATLVPAATDSLTWTQASKLPLCLLDPAMHGRRIVDRALADNGLTVVPAVQANSIAALCAHVETGRWASVVPHLWAQAWALPPHTHVVELREPSVRSRVGLAATAATPRSPIASAFVACVRELAREGALSAT